ncbi:hypothetical protein ACOME3_006110 [Neoechinorhynchus agilis]
MNKFLMKTVTADDLDDWNNIIQSEKNVVKEDEPESVRKWREDFSERIRAKDDLEQKTIEQWKEKAKLELEAWMKDQDEKLKKSIEAEKEELTKGKILKKMGSVYEANSGGNIWERIAHLCEFGQPKTGKSPFKADLGRMKMAILARVGENQLSS